MKHILALGMLFSTIVSASPCEISSGEALAMLPNEIRDLAFSCTHSVTYQPGLQIGKYCNLNGFEGMEFPHLGLDVHGERVRATTEFANPGSRRALRKVINKMRAAILTNQCNE